MITNTHLWPSLGYDSNFDYSQFGAALYPTNQSLQSIQTASKNIKLTDWQIANLQSQTANPWDLYVNPCNSVCVSLASNLHIALNTFNSLPQPRSGTDNVIGAVVSTCIQALDNFRYHTDNLSGMNSGNTRGQQLFLSTLDPHGGYIYPTLDGVTAVGTQLLPLLYKTDGINTTLPVLAGMTSLFLTNTITYGYNLGLTSWAQSYTGGDSSANYSMNTLITLLDSRRTSDTNYYANALTLLKNYAMLRSLEGIGVTKTWLINNLIGSPGLKSNLNATTQVVQSITITNGGSNYYYPPQVVINGDGSGASAHALVVDGKVTEVVIDNPGSGFTNATVDIVALDNGTGATATISLVGSNVVIDVTPTNNPAANQTSYYQYFNQF
jgi:hypothetical protein